MSTEVRSEIQHETFWEFLKFTVVDVTKKYFEPFVWLKDGTMFLVRKSAALVNKIRSAN